MAIERDERGRRRSRDGIDAWSLAPRAQKAAAVPGRITHTRTEAPSLPSASFRYAILTAHGAAARAEAMAPTLRERIAIGDYLESGRLALEIKWTLRRAVSGLEAIAESATDPAAEAELVAAQTRVVAVTEQVASLLLAAPTFDAVGSAHPDVEAKWAEEAAALAPLVGLGGVDVHADQSARGVTESAGARGVALRGDIYMHPERVSPGTAEGREVLAHELVHLAQGQLDVGGSERDVAEEEAAALAPILVRGGSVRPRVGIDLSVAAGDTHARTRSTARATVTPQPDQAVSRAGSLTPDKTRLKLPRTIVGESASPRTLRIYNTGEEVAELGAVRALDDDTARIFPVHAAVLGPIQPGELVEIKVGFEPESTRIASGDYQLLDGGGALASTVHVFGDGMTREEAAHRAVDRGKEARAETFADLEAALALSVKLAASDDVAERQKATTLAELVVHRLDAIENEIHDVSGDYGVASTTMLLSWGHASSAVKTWWRGLVRDLRPRDGDVVLDRFRVVREIVQLGTGELAHSRIFDKLDSPEVTIAATILPLAATCGIALAPEVLAWIQMNPALALTAFETSVAVGPQIIEAGGVVPFLKAAVSDPARALDVIILLTGVYADYQATRGGRGTMSPAPDLDDPHPPVPQRAPQRGDPDHEFHYDQMRPGPLSDRKTWDPKGTGATLPATGFYGGKYDEIVLQEDKVLYRVGNGEREWGEWFTDQPLRSEAQYRIDVAVKREWSDPATGTMPEGSARSAAQLDLWSYSILIPKGTTVYSGPVGTQGGVHMGGLSQTQYFIPKAWTLESRGGKVVAKAPFKRDGHVQPEPQEQDHE